MMMSVYLLDTGNEIVVNNCNSDQFKLLKIGMICRHSQINMEVSFLQPRLLKFTLQVYPLFEEVNVLYLS